jgi:TadE-like protein
MKKAKCLHPSSGQALIETALVIPFLLLFVLNVINFGYFFIMALNVTASPRSGVEYAILGFQTPNALALPDAGPPSTTTTISYLSQQDLTGAVLNPTSSTIQVCSSKVGIAGSGASTTSKCVSCTGSSCGSSSTGNPAPASDPEAPIFTLNRVDVDYVFSPPIPGTPFGLALLPMPNCSVSGGSVSCRFHRQVSMRAMN